MRSMCSLAAVILACVLGMPGAFAASPADCPQTVQASNPCRDMQGAKVPVLDETYPVEQMLCLDYEKLSGATGTLTLYALVDFNPNDVAHLEQQLAKAVFKDARAQTQPKGEWCRGRHWFSGAKWVVFCDEKGGIGGITGESLQYALRNTWTRDKQPIVIGTMGH